MSDFSLFIQSSKSIFFFFLHSLPLFFPFLSFSFLFFPLLLKKKNSFFPEECFIPTKCGQQCPPFSVLVVPLLFLLLFIKNDNFFMKKIKIFIIIIIQNNFHLFPTPKNKKSKNKTKQTKQLPVLSQTASCTEKGNSLVNLKTSPNKIVCKSKSTLSLFPSVFPCFSTLF